MLSERKQHLLKLIVEHYIEHVQPIASRFLIEQADLGVGEATVRNEMRALEEAGYLTHPHTSAGRIPTEQGYKYYVEQSLDWESSVESIQKELQMMLTSVEHPKEALKTVAKYLAEQSGNAVMIAFDEYSVYYTGISQLFAQPEFQDYSHTVQVSSMFDHCEEKIGEVLQKMSPGSDFEILIGSENPLGSASSTIVLPLPNNQSLLLIGPLRMNYKQNIHHIRALHSALHS